MVTTLNPELLHPKLKNPINLKPPTLNPTTARSRVHYKDDLSSLHLNVTATQGAAVAILRRRR